MPGLPLVAPVSATLMWAAFYFAWGCFVKKSAHLPTPPPASDHPRRVDSDQHRGEAEPGQGVLEVVVGQARLHWARMREAAGRYRAFHLHIERRGIGDVLRRGHCRGIAGKPDVARGIAGGREQAGGFRPAQYADDVDAPRDRAVATGRLALPALRHEAAVHHDDAAVAEARRREQ